MLLLAARSLQLNMVPNVQVSDTTGDAISAAARFIKKPQTTNHKLQTVLEFCIFTS